MGLDEVLMVLSNERRRHVITVLGEEGGLPLADLRREVANRQADGEATGAEHKRVHVSLHQSHLPKLKEHGVVSDMEEDFIHQGPRFGLVHRVHEAAADAMEARRGMVTRLFG